MQDHTSFNTKKALLGLLMAKNNASVWDSSDSKLLYKVIPVDKSVESVNRKDPLGVQHISSLERDRDQVLVSEINENDDPLVEERLSYIRRASMIDRQHQFTLFVLSDNGNPSDIGEFLEIHTYYREHEKRIKRKKGKITVTGKATLPQPASGISSNPKYLSVQAWHVRYDFKLGVFAEFRQDLDGALRYYDAAYSGMINIMHQSQTFGGALAPGGGQLGLAEIVPGSLRWIEARVFLDSLSIKIYKLFVYCKNPVSALIHLHKHFVNCREFPEFAFTTASFDGITKDQSSVSGLGHLSNVSGGGSFQYWAWASTHYRVFGELIETASARTSMAKLPHLCLVHLAVSTQFLQFKMQDITMCSQVGCGGTMNKYKKAVNAFMPGRTLSRQSIRNHSRASSMDSSDIARIYEESGKYDMALEFFERISKTYRKELWFSILASVNRLSSDFISASTRFTLHASRMCIPVSKILVKFSNSQYDFCILPLEHQDDSTVKSEIGLAHTMNLIQCQDATQMAVSSEGGQVYWVKHAPINLITGTSKTFQCVLNVSENQELRIMSVSVILETAATRLELVFKIQERPILHYKRQWLSIAAGETIPRFIELPHFGEPSCTRVDQRELKALPEFIFLSPAYLDEYLPVTLRVTNQESESIHLFASCQISCGIEPGGALDSFSQMALKKTDFETCTDGGASLKEDGAMSPDGHLSTLQIDLGQVEPNATAESVFYVRVQSKPGSRMILTTLDPHISFETPFDASTDLMQVASNALPTNSSTSILSDGLSLDLDCRRSYEWALTAAVRMLGKWDVENSSMAIVKVQEVPLPISSRDWPQNHIQNYIFQITTSVDSLASTTKVDIGELFIRWRRSKPSPGDWINFSLSPLSSHILTFQLVPLTSGRCALPHLKTMKRTDATMLYPMVTSNSASSGVQELANLPSTVTRERLFPVLADTPHMHGSKHGKLYVFVLPVAVNSNGRDDPESPKLHLAVFITDQYIAQTQRFLAMHFGVVSVIASVLLWDSWSMVEAQPRLCAKATDYSACTNTASLAIAACNGKVVSVPDKAYYVCLCEGNQQLQQCYSVCPDDPQLQLQATVQKQTTFSTCKTSQDMLAAEIAANQSAVASTPSISSSSVSISTSATAPSPPRPCPRRLQCKFEHKQHLRHGNVNLARCRHLLYLQQRPATMVVVASPTDAQSASKSTATGIGSLPPPWALSASTPTRLWKLITLHEDMPSFKEIKSKVVSKAKVATTAVKWNLEASITKYRDKKTLLLINRVERLQLQVLLYRDFCCRLHITMVLTFWTSRRILTIETLADAIMTLGWLNEIESDVLMDVRRTTRGPISLGNNKSTFMLSNRRFEKKNNIIMAYML
ncbi:hypothetical protein BSLG_004327 [Batrachochytrium salamandrivorans]|nr:hypothetical protein BSLG_004327 [Batrachochytrium salamandrivorans]